MTDVLVAVAVMTLALSTPLIARVKREYEADGVLSTTTVVAVWVLYTVIVAVVVLAAADEAWEIGFPAAVELGLGLPLIAAGAVLTAAGVAAMASFRRMSGIQPDRLITSGVFRFSRNPQNVGIGIALAGLAIASGSGLALATAAGFWAVFYAYVRYEERHLERAFGPEYRSYLRRTPRFLGLPRDPGVP